MISGTSRKGQVTIFIIIGIVILFAFAGILYVTKTSTSDLVRDQGDVLIATVPQEFQSIQTYTENCISQIATQGLIILGQQGGYIYPEVEGAYSAADPTNSDGLVLEDLKIPYWRYNSKPNSDLQISYSSLKPQLRSRDGSGVSVEDQLGQFVDEELNKCLKNYASFEQQGFQITADEAAKQTTTRVLDKGVSFLLEMNVQAQKGTAKTEMDKFYVVIPLNLEHYYDLASQITEAEKNYTFMESQAMSLIETFSSLDTNKLPPTDAVTFDLAPTKFWQASDAKQHLKQILNSYVPMLQFYGSHNLQFYQYPQGELSGLFQKDYENMIIPLKGAEDVEVRFNYFNWEPYVNVNDNEGIVQPQSLFVQRWFFAFGMQRYSTTYDLSYPVMVSIDDPLAFDGKGYQFNIALESNIRNNRAPEDQETIPAPVTAFRESLACNKEQWDSVPVKSVVVDSFTGEPLEAVRVGLTIPNQDDCTMGLTDSQGKLEKPFPKVYGGVVNYIKNDYLINYYPLDTYKLNDKTSIVGYAATTEGKPIVELHKFKDINVTVKKISLKKCLTPAACKYTISLSDWAVKPFTAPFGLKYADISCDKGEPQCFFKTGPFDLPEKVASYEVNGSLSRNHDYYFINSKPKALADEEQATISLTRVADLNENIKSQEYTAVSAVKGSEVGEMRLVPGIYKVEGTLSLQKEVTIPRDERSMQINLFVAEKDYRYDINETKLKGYLQGRISWDSEATYLRITPEDLYTSDNLEFYLPSQDMDKIPEKMEAPQYECASFACLPGVGCTMETCVPKTIEIPGKVIEEMQMMGTIGNISRMPNVRVALEPSFD